MDFVCCCLRRSDRRLRASPTDALSRAEPPLLSTDLNAEVVEVHCVRVVDVLDHDGHDPLRRGELDTLGGAAVHYGDVGQAAVGRVTQHKELRLTRGVGELIHEL